MKKYYFRKEKIQDIVMVFMTYLLQDMLRKMKMSQMLQKEKSLKNVEWNVLSWKNI